MRLSDIKLDPGDRIFELKDVIVQRATGAAENYTISEEIVRGAQPAAPPPEPPKPAAGEAVSPPPAETASEPSEEAVKPARKSRRK